MEKARDRESKRECIGVMKEKELKLEDVKDPHTLGGASCILFLYINPTKEVLNNLEVELYKPRTISLEVDSASLRGWVWLR